jgi:hypothetical protein
MYRIFIWPTGIALFFYIGSMVVLLGVIQNDAAFDIVLRNPVRNMLIAMFLPILLLFLIVGRLIFRAKKYERRFRKRQGRLCFRCDYDLLEGQHTCPECGLLWEPEKLKMGWKKIMQCSSSTRR